MQKKSWHKATPALSHETRGKLSPGLASDLTDSIRLMYMAVRQEMKSITGNLFKT